MGSSRLPGKALKVIAGKSILEWQILRLKRSLLIDEIVVATTTESQDDVLEKEAYRLGVGCYRGSEHDVLARVCSAMKRSNADIHIEFYGDSPFVDAYLIDQTIGYLLKNYDKVDYVSTGLKTTYPPGLEVTAYKSFCLEKAQKTTETDDPLREHTGPNIHKIKEFTLVNLEAPRDLYYPEFYYEIDTEDDYKMLSAFISLVVDQHGEAFTTQNLIEIAKAKPEIIQINSAVHRRWKKFRKK
tara:strand:+ start:1163 stop:1888 length:726 start_codon:yes stop_codon:yes gene_type:complete